VRAARITRDGHCRAITQWARLRTIEGSKRFSLPEEPGKTAMGSYACRAGGSKNLVQLTPAARREKLARTQCLTSAACCLCSHSEFVCPILADPKLASTATRQPLHPHSMDARLTIEQTIGTKAFTD
jgi:hypothetical protein